MATSPVYDTIGRGYVAHRRPEPRWEAVIAEQLGDGARRRQRRRRAPAPTSRADRAVVAVEPSSVMVGQRPPRRGAGRAGQRRRRSRCRPGCADVALAILTVHHWDDWAAGLAELCRVAPATRRPGHRLRRSHARFWLLEDYLPEVGEYTRRARPDADEIADGHRAPRRRAARRARATCTTACSAPTGAGPRRTSTRRCGPTAPGLALADPAVIARGVAALEADLASGAWQRRHADLADLRRIDLGYRLVVGATALSGLHEPV